MDPYLENVDFEYELRDRRWESVKELVNVGGDLETLEKPSWGITWVGRWKPRIKHHNKQMVVYKEFNYQDMNCPLG